MADKLLKTLTIDGVGQDVRQFVSDNVQYQGIEIPTTSLPNFTAVVTNALWTAPDDGIAFINAKLQISENPNGTRYFYTMINDAPNETVIVPAPPQFPSNVVIMTAVPVSKNDTFKVGVVQTSGTALSLVNSNLRAFFIPNIASVVG